MVLIGRIQSVYEYKILSILYTIILYSILYQFLCVFRTSYKFLSNVSYLCALACENVFISTSLNNTGITND